MNYYSIWWFGNIWDANALLYYREITLMEYVLQHFSVMVFFYLVIFLILLIFATAFLTIGERSIIADFQNRRGPKKVGFNGFLQPIADATKLILKEKVSVRFLQEYIFSIAAWAAFAVSSILWLMLPLGLETMILNFDYTSFLFFNISILHVFALIFASWASKSKYSMLGGLRTAGQLISYELCIGLVISCLFKFAKTLSIVIFMYMNAEIGYICFFLIGIAVIFIIAGLAELNRHPFDLPEAEAELVSGYNVEYTGIRFALFFLGEYLSLIFYAIMFNDIYLGQTGYLLLDYLKVGVIVYIIISIRALIPRYRYDQLMSINWKFFLPVLASVSYFITQLNIFLV